LNKGKERCFGIGISNVLIILDTVSLDLEYKIKLCALYFSNYVGELTRAL